MAERLCFVDLDGVVADLHTPLCELFGARVEDWPLGEDKASVALGRSAKEIWEHPTVASADFWAKVPMLPWARELLRELDRIFEANNVAFLTAPILAPGCTEGKARWIREHFARRAFLIGPDKGFCAAPGRYLIDDREKSLEQFRARGGVALLFPRRWNALHAVSDPVGHVISRICELEAL